MISVAALLGLARVVEPVYGSKEFLKFIAVVDLMVGSVVFVAVYIGFAVRAGSLSLPVTTCSLTAITSSRQCSSRGSAAASA